MDGEGYLWRRGYDARGVSLSASRCNRRRPDSRRDRTHARGLKLDLSRPPSLPPSRPPCPVHRSVSPHPDVAAILSPGAYTGNANSAPSLPSLPPPLPPQSLLGLLRLRSAVQTHPLRRRPATPFPRFSPAKQNLDIAETTGTMIDRRDETEGRYKINTSFFFWKRGNISLSLSRPVSRPESALTRVWTNSVAVLWRAERETR